MVLIHHGWRQNQRDIRGWYFTISFCYIRGCKLLWKTFEERTWFAAVNGCRCRWPFTVDRRPNTSRTPFFHFTFVNILLTDFLLPFFTTTFYFCFSLVLCHYNLPIFGCWFFLQWCNHVSIFWRKISFLLMVYCIFYGSKRWKSRSFSSTFNAPCWFFADQSTVERMNEELKLYVPLRSNRIAHTGPFPNHRCSVVFDGKIEI